MGLMWKSLDRPEPRRVKKKKKSKTSFPFKHNCNGEMCSIQYNWLKDAWWHYLLYRLNHSDPAEPATGFIITEPTAAVEKHWRKTLMCWFPIVDLPAEHTKHVRLNSRSVITAGTHPLRHNDAVSINMFFSGEDFTAKWGKLFILSLMLPTSCGLTYCSLLKTFVSC